MISFINLLALSLSFFAIGLREFEILIIFLVHLYTVHSILFHFQEKKSKTFASIQYYSSSPDF